MLEDIFNDEQERTLERILETLHALDLIDNSTYVDLRLRLSLAYYLFHRDERW